MVIDRALFAQECVRQGTIFAVNPHFLLSVAQFQSGISDDSDGDKIGPFRLKQGEWNANCNSDEFDLHFTPTQISSATRQCAVAGFIMHRAFDAFQSKNGRDPSAKELYLQQWPDKGTNAFDGDFQKSFDDTAALMVPAASAVLDDPRTLPPLITNINQKTTRPVPPLDGLVAPEWYVLASKEIGTHEEGNNSGPAIARYRQLAQCGSDHDPWCAIFANAMFALCKPLVPGTKSASSQSFRSNPNFTKLSGPALGAVAVFWRNSPRSELGHVGFYRGETLESVYVLGGNEDNMVEIAPVSKHQLRGYWWPASLRQPTIGKITVPPGTPKQTTTVTLMGNRSADRLNLVFRPRIRSVTAMELGRIGGRYYADSTAGPRNGSATFSISPFRRPIRPLAHLERAGILTERTGYARNRIYAANEALAIIYRPFGEEPIMPDGGEFDEAAEASQTGP